MESLVVEQGCYDSRERNLDDWNWKAVRRWNLRLRVLHQTLRKDMGNDGEDMERVDDVHTRSCFEDSADIGRSKERDSHQRSCRSCAWNESGLVAEGLQ